MAGVVSQDDDKLLMLWQERAFLVDNFSNEAPGKLADGIRSLLLQLQFAKKTDRLSSSCANELTRDYFQQYAAIVDDPKGLNTFSEGALTLASHKKCESKLWKSSLADLTNSELLSLLTSTPLAEQPHQPTPEQLNYLSDIAKKHSKKLSPPPEVNDPVSSHSPKQKYYHHPFGNNVQPPSHSHSLNDSDMLKPRNHMVFPQPGANKFHANVHEEPKSNFTFYNLYEKQDKVQNCQAANPSLRSSTGFEDARQSHWKQYCSPTTVYQKENELNSNSFCNPQKRKQREEDAEEPLSAGSKIEHHFRTAKEQLIIDKRKKVCGNGKGSVVSSDYNTNKKSLGPRKGPNSKFIPPVLNKYVEDEDGHGIVRLSSSDRLHSPHLASSFQDERLKNVDPKMVEIMMNEIMDHGPPVSWDDIAGLEFAKKTIVEIIIWPMLRPDIFTGLRGPPKGILLFGPPGTGKTLIGKCIASQSRATFFCISASSLTSKWVGDGEKLVRALFAVARCHQPAVIFIDEVDSLLTQRSDSEHESSRRIKTEFLVQLDGATTGTDERLLVVGATNRPQELDEAARRRFVKRLYIPLPEAPARRQIVLKLLVDQKHSLEESDMDDICAQTAGYSGADMANLCKEASLGPIRSLSFVDIESITSDQLHPISLQDFHNALRQVRASVSERDLELYADWNNKYGSGSV